MTEQAETVQHVERSRAGLKRRGILAAAGAVVAGIVAKQTSQPVAASVPNYVASGGSGNAFEVGSSGYGTGVSTTGMNYGLYSSTAGGYAVYGVTSGSSAPNYAGVYGGAGGAGNFGVRGVGAGSTSGVGGQSDSGIGVSGSIPAYVGIAPPMPNTAPNTVAVNGINQSTGTGGIGVVGMADPATTIGVIGVSAAGTGVKGASTIGLPVLGQVLGSANTAAGILGAGTAGPGVQGQSTGGHGLVGTTDAKDGHAGLIGNATTAGGIGVMGIAPGYNTQSVGEAAIFYGNVSIHGNFNAPVVKAVVKHQGDGSYRLLQGMASPEGWIEDFGHGTLSADKADIRIDHDFAALIDPSTLRVFLTARGPQHLYVEQVDAAGFTVIATAIGGVGGPKRADGSGTFFYRVVAKRKDIASERLAKVAPPTAPKAPAALAIPKTPDIKPPTTTP